MKPLHFFNDKKHAIAAISLLLSLSGCSSSPDDNTLAQRTVQDTSSSMRVFDISGTANHSAYATVDEEHSGAQFRNDIEQGQLPDYSSVQGAYKGRPLPHHIGDYVKNLTQNLIGNMQTITSHTPIAVTHFALLDSNLQETNLLGHQMAESFVHELHKFRIPVIDYKATQFIRVTDQGDFFLSRDYLELSTQLPMEFVLTGTLTKHQGGYLVNARILGLQNKAVVASAQSFIPFYVVEALIPSERIHDESSEGIKLTQG